MTDIPYIYDLERAELIKLIAGLGEPAYRAAQIWNGLYKNFWNTPEEFTNLPRSLREQLGQWLRFEAIKPVHYLDSSDTLTRKTLFQLPDQRVIEAVLMKYGDPADLASLGGRGDRGEGKKRRTLCISSQAGCAMGCVFCATGQMGFKRNLSSGEIVAQVLYSLLRSGPGIKLKLSWICHVVAIVPSADTFVLVADMVPPRTIQKA